MSGDGGGGGGGSIGDDDSLDGALCFHFRGLDHCPCCVVHRDSDSKDKSSAKQVPKTYLKNLPLLVPC